MASNYLPTRRTPIIGDWLGKIGAIQDIIATPCHITPKIYVSAFFAGIPRMAWALAKPDYFDDRKDFIRRPGGKSNPLFGPRHGRRRRRRMKVDELLESEFPEAGGFGKYAFKLGELAERLGWYLMIIDASLDLDIYWMSTAYQWSGCQQPYGAAEATCNDTVTYGPSSGWKTISTWSWEGDAPGAGLGPANISVDPGVHFMCGLTLGFGTPHVPLHPFGTVTGTRIAAVYPSGFNIELARAELKVKDGKSHASTYFQPFTTHKGMTVEVQVYATGGFWSTTGGMWQVSTGPYIKRPGLGYDP